MSNILPMEIPMSAIPYPLDPMGSNLGPYFTLVVKPGILGASLTYGFTPYWNTGGYCKVVDWGGGRPGCDCKRHHTYAHLCCCWNVHNKN